MVTNRETDCFSFARSFTLSNLYLVSDFTLILPDLLTLPRPAQPTGFLFYRHVHCLERQESTVELCFYGASILSM